MYIFVIVQNNTQISDQQEMTMNSNDSNATAQQKPPHWRSLLTSLGYWIKSLDYSAYEHTSLTTRQLAESISILEQRVIALAHCQQKKSQF